MIKVLNRKALTSAGGWIGSSPENLSIKKYELKLKKSDPTKSTLSLKFSLHNHAKIFNQLQAEPDKHKLDLAHSSLTQTVQSKMGQESQRFIWETLFVDIIPMKLM